MEPVAEGGQIAGKIQVLITGIEGLGVHAVEMDWSGSQRLLGQRLIHRAQHEGRGYGRGGARQVLLIDGVATEDPLLIDRLVGAVVDKLGRAIGREDNQRHACELRLRHGGPKVGDRRARGHDHRHRSATALGQPQRHKPQAPLVKMEVAA